MPTETSPSATELRLRQDLHGTMERTRDVLDDLGSYQTLIEGDVETVEDDFDQFAGLLVELVSQATALRDVPDLTVEGAQVAGSVDTVIVVLRSTLATVQASLDAHRGDQVA